MIAAWMLYTLGTGVLMGAATLAADRCCRMLRRGSRLVWLAGIVATVVLSGTALFEMVRPEPVPAPVPAWEGPAHQAAGGERPAGIVAYLREVGARARTAAAVAADAAYRAAADTGLTRALLVLWFASSAALLILLLATVRRIGRARGGWHPHRVGGVSVLVSHDDGPALVGLVRPGIVVPAWLLREPPETQRLVVQHEDEHRKAGDHILLAFVFVTVALMPWNPALWWMLRRTRLAVEVDCDARVLRRGAAARCYGSLLLEIAGRTRARALGAPALADSRTDLERRLIAMTEVHRAPHPARALAAAGAALMLGLAACAQELPTAAAIEEMDVEQVEMRAKQAGVIQQRGSDTLVYVIDGVRAREEDALRLAPDEIASIEVVKGGTALEVYGGRDGVIRITTKPGSQRERMMRELAVASDSLRMKRPLGVPLHDAAQADEELRARRLRETNEVRLRRQSAAPEDAPLVVIDGRVPPLVVIDGKIESASFELGELRPESIERIEIVKGEAARLRYDDPRAVNGVILIYTKKGGR
ncbi:MAG TPA: M56 family metallopeptidase [Longimicrobiales bacterium]